MRTPVITLLLVTLAQVSCGGNDEPGVPTSRTPASPSGAPPGGPSGDGGGQAIGAVREEFTNDAVSPTDCEYPWIFTVREDGSYEAGPCERGGSKTRGSISNTELAELDRRADAVVAQDLAGPADCDASGSIGSMIFDVISPEGETARFYSLTPEGLCTLGDRSLAEGLSSYVHGLTTKYYPRRQN